MRNEQKQTLLWVFLAFIGAAMLAALIAIILPDRYVSGEVMFTISLVGVYALGGLIVVAISRDMKWSTRVAFTSFAISMLIYIAFIWFERAMSGRTEDLLFKIGTIALTVGFTFTHRLLICPLGLHTGIGQLAKRVALITAWLTAGIFCVGIITDGFYGWNDTVVRLLGITLVICAGSSIATGALAIFGPRAGADEPGLLSESIRVHLTCPRCEQPIDARSNRDTRCACCRLRVRVDVEEPRCGCGYLLYQLDSDTCPECGKPINPEDRWRPRPA